MTLAGSSDEWITSYVGYCLSFCQDSNAQQCAEKAGDFLLKRRKWLQSGWGYSKPVPSDADSTAWSLALFARLKYVKNLRIRKAYRFLKKHFDDEGGIRTFRSSGLIKHYTKLSKKISFDGWCSSHTCVTSSTLSLGLFPIDLVNIEFLLKKQTEKGYWDSYWWNGPEYATSFAIEVLSNQYLKDTCQYIRKADQWIRWQLNSNIFTENNPFKLALYLRMAINTNIEDSIEKIGQSLISIQNEDGSWPSGAELRIPTPGMSNPNNYKNWSRSALGGGSIRIDQNRLFTTATVVLSLQKLMEL